MIKIGRLDHLAQFNETYGQDFKLIRFLNRISNKVTYRSNTAFSGVLPAGIEVELFKNEHIFFNKRDDGKFYMEFKLDMTEHYISSSTSRLINNKLKDLKGELEKSNYKAGYDGRKIKQYTIVTDDIIHDLNLFSFVLINYYFVPSQISC